jgi:hypothetical protein
MRIIVISMFILLACESAFLLMGLSMSKEDKKVPVEWSRGDYILYRKQLPHGGCSGYLNFNGQTTPAPYSETERFYTHVCDKCSSTNSILNDTWPKFKREWRDL